MLGGLAIASIPQLSPTGEELGFQVYIHHGVPLVLRSLLNRFDPRTPAGKRNQEINSSELLLFDSASRDFCRSQTTVTIFAAK